MTLFRTLAAPCLAVTPGLFAGFGFAPAMAQPLRICTPGPLKYWSGETGSGVPNLYYLPVAAGTVVLNQ